MRWIRLTYGLKFVIIVILSVSVYLYLHRIRLSSTKEAYRKMGVTYPSNKLAKTQYTGILGEVTHIYKAGEMTDKPPKRDVSFYRFNTTMSDIIGPYRTIPDKRPEQCKHIKYPDHLPKISVVVIFREEWPSLLVRTIYSILNNSPPALLQEIIIVDDGSIDTEPRFQVETHFANTSTVKLIVNPKPLGLMMARQSGIEATSSDYFVVMDSHMEVRQGWLAPLVARLVEKPSNLVSTHIGTIDPNTFHTSIVPYGNKHFIAFDPLTLSEIWATYSAKFTRLTDGSVDPLPIASVQGAGIAMRKDVFMRLGGFDPGMKQWGSEQFELSIKVWLCGGRVEKIPCSKVFHLYRVTPWGKTNLNSDHMVANSLRAVEVWMDDPHKTIIRESIGRHSKYVIGDLTGRHKIRKQNHCKPYKYFVDTVKTFSDVYMISGVLKASGNLRLRLGDSYRCLSMEKQGPKVYKLDTKPCKNESKSYFILTEHGQIRSIHATVVRVKIGKVQDIKAAVEVVRSPAYSYMENAVWEYRTDETLHNMASKRCLTLGNDNVVAAEKCNGFLNQRWNWRRA